MRVALYFKLYPPLILLIQASIRSGMPDTKLSSIFELILDQADRTFLVSVLSDVAGAILFTSSWTIAHRLSIVDGSGLFPRHLSFSQNAGKCDQHHSCVILARCAGAPSSWKMALDMFGRSLASVEGPFVSFRVIADVAILLRISSA